MKFDFKRLVFPSIKGSLTFWMLLFLFPVLLIITFRSYFSVQHFANAAHDEALFNVAISISYNIDQNSTKTNQKFPSLIENFNKYVNENHFHYLILDNQQERVLGNAQLTLPKALPWPGEKTFYDAKIGDDQLRLVAFSYPAKRGNLLIVVGETLALRDSMKESVIAVFIVSELIIVIFIIIALNLSLNRGLSSFDKVKQLILKRKPTDTEPIDDADVPTEVRSIVLAMNDLMRRVKEMVDHRQQFISNASHQLKTPLAGLKVQVENVLNEEDPQRIKHALTQISHSADKLTRLDQQLLSLARIDESGINERVQFTNLDLVQLVGGIVAEWVPMALTKKIDLGMQIHTDSLSIVGSAFLIEEMLSNLIDNALQYNTAGAKVTVRLERVDSEAYIVVEDNGRGIPENEHEKIFQRFYRAAGNANQSNGCGLGMPIVREIMQHHHGEVIVHFTNAENQSGTTVRCQFPL